VHKLSIANIHHLFFVLKIAAISYHKGSIFSLVQPHLSHLFISWMILGQLKLLAQCGQGTGLHMATLPQK